MFIVFLYISFDANASIIYIEPITQPLFYNCPFDIKVMVDTQWEDVIWASLQFHLTTWLTLKWLNFGEQFTFNFPPQSFWDNILVYGFKFPGTLSWIYEFATMRLYQEQLEWTGLSKLNFVYKWAKNGSDYMDVYYFWWADSLTEIENDQIFTFTYWDCPSNQTWLIWDLLSPTFDPTQHMAALQGMIDTHNKDLNKNNKFYKYYLFLLIPILFLLFLIRKKYLLKKSQKSPLQ